MRVALVEDDSDQSQLISVWLAEAGYVCRCYESGKAFVAAAPRESFDCVILDWNLPGVTGIEVLKWIREGYSPNIPVLFCTSREEESDIVRALKEGADDYLVKPVRNAELLARIAAVYRRSFSRGQEITTIITAPPYVIDPVKEEVMVRGRPVSLTRKEFGLVHFLFSNVGRIVSRNHILETVWGTDSSINTRTVDTHISRLRSKLELNLSHRWRLTSVYQHGYRLEDLESSAGQPESESA